MSTDSKAKKIQAQNAGKASGRSRAEKNKTRDENICLAYDFLKNNYQTQKQRLRAFEYISSFSEKSTSSRVFNTVNLKQTKGEEIESILTFLSERVGVTRQRIHQIVKNGKNTN